MRDVEVVFYASAADNSPAQQRLTPVELATLLTTHDETPCCYPCRRCAHKDGLAWSPGFIPEGLPRGGANVTHFDVLAYDIDDATPEQLEEVLERLDGTMALVASSHRYQPEAPRVRVVLFLGRRVPVAEYRVAHAAIAQRYGLDKYLDKKSRDPSHLYFLPSCPSGAPRLGVFDAEGTPVDVDAAIAHAQRLALPPPRATGLGRPQTAQEALREAEGAPVDLDVLRAILRRYAPDDDFDGHKRALVHAVLAGDALSDKGGRDDSVHRAATIIGWLAPLGTPPEAALELLRPSLAALPHYEDDEPHENLDGWLAKARRSFSLAAEKKLAEAEARDKTLAAVRQLARQRSGAATAAPADGDGEDDAGAPGPVVAGSTEDREAWRARLLVKVARDGRVVPEQVSHNAVIALTHHPDWRGALRYNVLTNTAEACGGPISEAKRGDERLVISVQSWLMTELGLDLQRNDVSAVLDYVAMERRYDPIREYLLGLQWDGVERIGSWLRTYCGAREDPMGVGRLWLIGGAARGIDPGCKMDNALIFEGNQRVGKSTSLSILGGPYAAEVKGAVNHRDTLEVMNRSWIVELPELASMRKGETESLKAFFSTPDDHYRLAYKPRIQRYLRHAICAGTTNDDEYLHDATGNTRYWPVRTTAFDIPALARDRDQLWAEAAAVYLAGETCPACKEAAKDDKRARCRSHRWWLERDESVVLDSITDERMRTDYADIVREWWFQKAPEARPEYLTTATLAKDVLGIAVERIESQYPAIGRAMKRLQWERRQVKLAGVLRWAYMPPDRWKDAPKSARGTFDDN